MFKWSGIYINPSDVAAINTGTDSSKSSPFYMTVILRGGQEFRTFYAAESARDYDSARLAQEVSKLYAEPVTKEDVESIVSKAKDAIRRDIKALRSEVF